MICCDQLCSLIETTQNAKITANRELSRAWAGGDHSIEVSSLPWHSTARCAKPCVDATCLVTQREQGSACGGVMRHDRFVPAPAPHLQVGQCRTQDAAQGSDMHLNLWLPVGCRTVALRSPATDAALRNIDSAQLCPLCPARQPLRQMLSSHLIVPSLPLHPHPPTWVPTAASASTVSVCALKERTRLPSSTLYTQTCTHQHSVSQTA
jgi:hypothetical protein